MYKNTSFVIVSVIAMTIDYRYPTSENIREIIEKEMFSLRPVKENTN